MHTFRRIPRPATRHSIVLAGLVALAGGLTTAAADAHASSPETFTTIISVPYFPSAPPYTTTYGGTFSVSGTVADSGTVSAYTQFAAVPAPHTGVLETTQTLTGSAGTIVLRCTQQEHGASNLSSGSCSIHDASGAYAGLTGAAKLTGVTDFNALTVTDTIVLQTP
jgi:hypothetical protein